MGKTVLKAGALALFFLSFSGWASADSLRGQLYWKYREELSKSASPQISDELSDQVREKEARRNPDRTYESYPSDRILAHYDALTDHLLALRKQGRSFYFGGRKPLVQEFIERAKYQSFLFRQLGNFNDWGMVELLPALPEIFAEADPQDRIPILQFWAIGLGILLDVVPASNPVLQTEREKLQTSFLTAYRESLSQVYRRRMTPSEIEELERRRAERGSLVRSTLRPVLDQIGLWPAKPLKLADYIPHSMGDLDSKVQWKQDSPQVKRYQRDLEAYAALLDDVRRPIANEDLALTFELLDQGPEITHTYLRGKFSVWLTSMKPMEREQFLLGTPAGQFVLDYARRISVEQVDGMQYGEIFKSISDLVELVTTEKTMAKLGMNPAQIQMISAARNIRTPSDLGEALAIYTHYKSTAIVCSQGLPNYHLELTERRIRDSINGLKCTPEVHQILTRTLRVHYGAFEGAMTEKLSSCDRAATPWVQVAARTH